MTAARAPLALFPSSLIPLHLCMPQPPSNFSQSRSAAAAAAAAAVQCSHSQSQVVVLRAVTVTWPRPLPSLVSDLAEIALAPPVVKVSLTARGDVASARE